MFENGKRFYGLRSTYFCPSIPQYSLNWWRQPRVPSVAVGHRDYHGGFATRWLGTTAMVLVLYLLLLLFGSTRSVCVSNSRVMVHLDGYLIQQSNEATVRPGHGFRSFQLNNKGNNHFCLLTNSYTRMGRSMLTELLSQSIHSFIHPHGAWPATSPESLATSLLVLLDGSGCAEYILPFIMSFYNF